MIVWDAIPYIVNALIILAVPVILLMIHLTSTKRAREIRDVQETFNTFENALITRITRLEERLDYLASHGEQPHA